MRERRVAENEGVFRSINERIEELAERVDDEAAVAEFVCECAAVDCTDRFVVPLADYERVRAHPRRFLVLANHEQPEVERVIDEGQGWVVVEKVGAAGEQADEDDPRRA